MSNHFVESCHIKKKAFYSSLGRRQERLLNPACTIPRLNYTVGRFHGIFHYDNWRHYGEREPENDGDPSYDGEGEPANYGRENEQDHETL